MVIVECHVFHFYFGAAVDGGLDLHGRQRSPVQSRLISTAAAGATSLSVEHVVDWRV